MVSSSGCPGGTRASSQSINGTLFQTCVASDDASVGVLAAEIIAPILGTLLLVTIIVVTNKCRATLLRNASGGVATQARHDAALALLSPTSRTDLLAGVASETLMAELASIKHAEWTERGSRATTRALCEVADLRRHLALATAMNAVLNDPGV